MTAFLIPIRAFTLHTLAAVRFAIEFGKRNRVRLYFLFVDDPESGLALPDLSGGGRSDPETDSIRTEIASLIGSGREAGDTNVKLLFCRGDFLEEIRRFSEDYSISGIVVSMPGEDEENYEQVRRETQILLKLTHCRIVTVKQKNRGYS